MNYFLRIAVVSLLSLSAINAIAQKKIYIMGSSTSACVGPTNANDCYVNRLAAYYNQAGPLDTTVTSIAASGYNCYRGMPTGYVPPYAGAEFQPNPATNITYALSFNPDVIIVNYPSNAYDFLPYDSIMYCLRTIKNVANAAGKVCYITTSQPRSQFDAAGRARLKVVRDSVLNAFGYFALNFWDDITNPGDLSILPAYSSGDGIHINGAGHQLFYQKVLDKAVFNVGLPARFVNFEALYKNKQVQISWITTNEINVDRYVIEKSKDGITFSSLADKTAYNSTAVNKYSFVDAQPLKGWNYFRIATIDKDGAKKYTPVFKVFVAAGKLSLQKLQQQQGQLQLVLQSESVVVADIQVLNTAGRVVAKEQRQIRNGASVETVNTNLLAAGVYYARIITSGQEPIITSFVKN